MFGFFGRNRELKKIEELTRRRRFDEAGAMLEKLMAAEPKNSMLQLFAAVNAFESGDVDAAGGHIEQALSLDPSNPMLHLAQGEVLHAKKQYEASLEALEKSADLSPDNPRTEYLMGLNHLALGHHEQATMHFESVAREDRDFLLARLLTLAEGIRIQSQRS